MASKKIKIKIKKNNGYVLIELIISMSLFSIILLSTTNLVFSLSKLNNKIKTKQDRLENILLANSFLVEQINRADKINIVTKKNNQLESIETFIYKNDSYESNHTFSFKNNSLNFGGKSNSGKATNNQLAQNISNITFDFDQQKKLLYIKIIAESIPSSNTVLYLKNKLINFNY
jgi:prepilin-type N-terminal cleavage/methylation domain-containing protein